MAIPDLLAKGPALTLDDLDEIKVELVLMPDAVRREKEGDIFEAIELIVADPEYQGDITLADLELVED